MDNNKNKDSFLKGALILGAAAVANVKNNV